MSIIKDTIRSVINKFDPMGIIISDNFDEYNQELPYIVVALEQSDNFEMFYQELYNTFQTFFGNVEAGDKVNYLKLSQEIWKLKNIKRSTPEV